MLAVTVSAGFYDLFVLLSLLNPLEFPFPASQTAYIFISLMASGTDTSGSRARTAS